MWKWGMENKLEYFYRGGRKYVTKRGDQVERGFEREGANEGKKDTDRIEKKKDKGKQG